MLITEGNANEKHEQALPPRHQRRNPQNDPATAPSKDAEGSYSPSQFQATKHANYKQAAQTNKLTPE
jgi:hypothetical protein